MVWETICSWYNLLCISYVYLLVRHVPFIAKSAEESFTERYGNMTNQQIYFSGLTRFVHTYLGLILYTALPAFTAVYKILCNAVVKN